MLPTRKTKIPNGEGSYTAMMKSLTASLGSATPLSESEITNRAPRYIAMGKHFEVLMTAIKNHPALEDHWEQLLVLLKLAGEDKSGQ